MGHSTGSAAALPPAAAALRPDTERGPIVATGIVLLTTFVVMSEARFADQWSTGVHFVLALLPFLLAYGIAVLTPPESGVLAIADDPATPEIDSARAWPAPRAWHSVVIVSSLVLFFFVVGNLADILGADDPFNASGTVMWMALLFAFVAFAPASFQWSGIAALATAVALGIAFLAFIDLVFDPEEISTFRWLLLLLIAGYIAAAVRLRDDRPRHSVHMVNAAGLALLALIFSFYLDAVFGVLAAFGTGGAGGGPNAGWGWEVVILVLSLGLIAYAALAREPGPGYLGFFALFFAAALVGLPSEEGEGSLIGWPIVILLGALAALAAGLGARLPAMRGLPGLPGRRGSGTPPAGPAPTPAEPAPPPPSAEPAAPPPRADQYSGPPAAAPPPPSAAPPTGDEPTQQMGSLDEPPPDTELPGREDRPGGPPPGPGGPPPT